MHIMNLASFSKNIPTMHFFKSILWVALATVLLVGCKTTSQSKKESADAKNMVETMSDVIQTPLYTLTVSVPKEVSIGDTILFNYNIIAKDDLESVQLIERMPEGCELISSQPEVKQDANTLTWEFDKIPNGGAKHVQLKLKAIGTGMVKSAAYLTPIPLARVQTKVGEPKIAIEQSAPPMVQVGQAIDLKITVKNPGTFVAKEVEVTYPIPEGITHTEGMTKLMFPIGDLPEGESRSFNVPIVATKRGTHDNIIAVATSNAGLETDTFKIKVVEPAFKITQKGPDQVYVGKPAEYAITVENMGDMPLSNLQLTNVAPTPLMLLDASKGEVQNNRARWHIPSIEIGESVTHKVVITSPTAGSFSNSATVSDQKNGLTDTASATTLWDGMAALSLEMVDNKDPVIIGEQTTYVVVVNNQGSAPDANVSVKLTFPDELLPVNTQGPTTGVIKGKTVTFAPISKLGAKQTVKFHIHAQSKAEGDARVKVELKSNAIKEPVIEYESTRVY